MKRYWRAQLAATVAFFVVLGPVSAEMGGLPDVTIETGPGGEAILGIAGEPNAFYLIEAAENLGDWADLATVQADSGGLAEFIHEGATAGFPRHFYRVSQAPDPTEIFVSIPAGTFTMGSPASEPGRFDDETQRTVTIGRDFYLAVTQVTWTQWNDVRDWAVDNGYTDLAAGQKGSVGDESNTDDDPVTQVSWWDALKWLNAWSQREGLTPVYYTSASFDETDILKTGTPDLHVNWDADGYRLPTEAEWEYACRAGTTTAFHTGPIVFTGSAPVDPNLDTAGWYAGNSGSNTHPVAQKQANAWGLYDTHGNVREWCWDWWGLYGSGPDTDPVGPSSGNSRVVRGGSAFDFASHCRSAYRGIRNPVAIDSTIGFRPARTAVPDE